MRFVVGPHILVQHLVYLLHQPLHQFVDVVLLAGNLFQRNRIRCIGDKNRLVDVQTNACDRVLNLRAYDGVLQQDTGQFLIVPIDIIRPLDREVLPYHPKQSHTNGDIEEIQVFCRRQQDGAQQVLACFTLPPVSGLSASCGLVAGPNEPFAFRPLAFGEQLFKQRVGTIGALYIHPAGIVV